MRPNIRDIEDDAERRRHQEDPENEKKSTQTPDPIPDETTPEELDKTLADSFPASDPPSQP